MNEGATTNEEHAECFDEFHRASWVVGFQKDENNISSVEQNVRAYFKEQEEFLRTL